MTNKSFQHGHGYIAVVCLLLVALTSITARAGQSDTAEPRTNSAAEIDLANPYAINLFSDLKPIDQSSLPKLEVFRKYRLYATRFEKDGRVWNRLRLGFFPTGKAARKVLDTLRGAFPVAWVTRVAKKEREESARFAITAAGTAVPKRPDRTGSTVLEQKILEKKRSTLPQTSEKHFARSEEGQANALSLANRVAEVDLSNPYAVNLFSDLKPIDQSTLPKLDVFRKYRLYATRFEKDGRVWNRLRLGFFPTEKAALKVLDTLRGAFPVAWVTRVAKKERKESARLAIAAPGIPGTKAREAPDSHRKTFPGDRVAETSSQGRGESARPFVAEAPLEVLKKNAQSKPPLPEQITVEKEKGTLPQMPEERLARLMEEAKKAMTSGSYRRAVQYYTKILEYPDHKFRQGAQEFLGLARERNRQLAHARAEYEKYLSLYTKGEAADRVRQRLAGLITARAKPKKKLRKAKKREARTEFYGSFSQFYNRYESFTDVGGNVVNQSALSSDMDVNIRRRSTAYNTSFVLVAGYDYDFLEDGPGGEPSLSQAYIDMLDRRRGISGRIGRQSRSTDGVLGRFDGGVLSYKLLPWLKVNGISGFPTNSSILESYDTNKFFYGLSMDLGTFADHWDFNLYSLRQEDEEIIDRQAVGGEMRYSHRNRSFFSLVDYDISYNELNTIMFVGNLIFPDKTTINTAVSYRKSPFLTTTNAIIGQGVDSLSDLLLTRSEDEIRKLATDRTATSRSATLGITRPLHQKLQVGVELTVTELTGTEASGGVEAMQGTGYEYFYSTQLIGSSLIKEGDIAILGLRYSDTSNSNTVSLNLNTRYPVIRAWRINPRIRVDYRQIHRNDVEQLKIRPSLRMDYYWKRRIRFEVDGGVDWSPDWISEQTDTSFDFFLNFGYRLYF